MSAEGTLAVLDLDGTLFDTLSLDVCAYRALLEELGLPSRTEAQLRGFIGPTIEQTAVVLGFAERDGQWLDQKLIAHERALMPSAGRLYDGAMELLRALSRRCEVYIASNGSPEYLEMVDEAFGLSRYVTAMHGHVPGDDKRQLFGRICRAHGGAPISAGDRAGDLIAARAHGARFAGALYGFGSREELSGSDALAADVRELADILLRWCDKQPKA